MKPPHPGRDVVGAVLAIGTALLIAWCAAAEMHVRDCTDPHHNEYHC